MTWIVCQQCGGNTAGVCYCRVGVVVPAPGVPEPGPLHTWQLGSAGAAVEASLARSDRDIRLACLSLAAIGLAVMMIALAKGYDPWLDWPSTEEEREAFEAAGIGEGEAWV